MCFKLVVYIEGEDGYKVSTAVVAHKVVKQEERLVVIDRKSKRWTCNHAEPIRINCTGV